MTDRNQLTLAIGSDHGGFELKQQLINFLNRTTQHLIIDHGTHSLDSVDYPVIAERVVQSILHQQADFGILVCGTGIGMSLYANRFKTIRAALVYDAVTAQLSREHNNANILCLGGRTLTQSQAETLLTIWLETPFSGNRHLRRIELLDSGV